MKDKQYNALMIMLLFGFMSQSLYMLFMDQTILDNINTKRPIEYDYIIKLEGNTDNGDIIKISSDGGEGWYVIHPDSLEEFITKDNL